MGKRKIEQERWRWKISTGVGEMVPNLDENMLRILEKTPLLRHVSTESIDILSSYLDLLSMKEGEELYSWGQAAKALFLSVSGDYLMAFPDGRSFTLHGSGRILGMNSLIPEKRYTARAIALTDGLLIALYKEKWLRLLQDNPHFREYVGNSIRNYLKSRRKGEDSTLFLMDSDRSWEDD